MASPELEDPPPDLRDLTLWARIVDRERLSRPLPQSRPWDGARVASPQRSTLRPGRVSLAELDAARQYRTIHLLIKPDILTCYRHVSRSAVVQNRIRSRCSRRIVPISRSMKGCEAGTQGTVLISVTSSTRRFACH